LDYWTEQNLKKTQPLGFNWHLKYMAYMVFDMHAYDVVDDDV